MTINDLRRFRAVRAAEQMPVRFAYEQGDAALEITTHGTGDGALTSLDARWLCGRINVRVTATSKETIREDDARKLLEHVTEWVATRRQPRVSERR